MKTLLPLFLLTASSLAAVAADATPAYTRTIFSDDFSAEGFRKEWGHYKSGSVVKDGVLVGITPQGSDHNAVDNIRFEGERDLEVSVKFRFVSEQAKGFNVWFDDKNYKGSHAGHICQVTLTPKNITLADAKTGTFENEIYARNKAGGLTADDKKMLATKRQSFPATISLQEWHTLVARTHGDELTVTLDGKPVGSLRSEGIGHDTKSLVSLTTNQVDVHYDDFSVKAPAKK